MAWPDFLHHPFPCDLPWGSPNGWNNGTRPQFEWTLRCAPRSRNAKGSESVSPFRKFHIRTGESATFTGDDAIHNVISRVTDGEASEINGKLSSKVGNAGFYFINPNGVIFGKGAQLDVPAAFKVSTATEIRFPDGGVFNAANPNASTLSIEKPEAYGFLGNQSGKIALELAKLEARHSTNRPRRLDPGLLWYGRWQFADPLGFARVAP